MHGKPNRRTLTANERHALKRKVAAARREALRVERIAARREFQTLDSLMRANRAGGF